MGTTGCLCLGKSSFLTVDSIIISFEEEGTFLSKYVLQIQIFSDFCISGNCKFWSEIQVSTRQDRKIQTG